MRANKINQFGDPVVQTKLYDFEAIQKARQIIEKNPSDHWVISILADKAGINERKLKKGFKELYRTTPYKFRTSLLLNRVKTMLEDTDCTIQEIAFKVGFESYKGLNKAFKNAYGILPTQYRKQVESMYVNLAAQLKVS